MVPSTASAKIQRVSEPASLPFPSLADIPLEDILQLLRTPRIGNITFFQLVSRFGSAERALAELPSLNKNLRLPSRGTVEQEIERAQQFGARLLRYGESDYPEWLMHVADPPPVLFCLGNPALWQNYACVGIVGARNASSSGCNFAAQLAKQLIEADITIVSGLARGIDTHAHRAAIERTVAVIAGGIDNIYPPENRELYEQIRERGAILSEQPFGSQPLAKSFPARNRIITGISRAVAVVEASMKSGTLITARLAAEQGRDVYAVPGFPLDPRASGCNYLLKNGATLLESARDILEALPHEMPPPPQMTLLESATNSEFIFEETEIKTPQNSENAQSRVLEKLGKTPVSIDELLMECQLTSGLLFTVLLELELAGRIERVPGNKICLNFSAD